MTPPPPGRPVVVHAHDNGTCRIHDPRCRYLRVGAATTLHFASKLAARAKLALAGYRHVYDCRHCAPV